MTDERIFELIEKQDKYYILGFIKGIKAHLEELQQENQQLRERIEKAVEYIKIYRSYENIDGKDYWKDKDEIGSLELSQVDDLLEILKGDSNE